MDAGSPAVVVLLNLHDKLVEKRQRTVDLFRKIDESGDGVVDPDEFRAGLDAFGFTTSDEDFKSLMGVLDKDGAVRLTSRFAKAIKAVKLSPKRAEPASKFRGRALPWRVLFCGLQSLWKSAEEISLPQ